jgi:hypothetical protein
MAKRTTNKKGKKVSAAHKSTTTNSSKKGPSGSKDSQPKDKCFVISPFGGWHDEYYNEIFCQAIKTAGLAPCRADDLFRSSNIVHDIWHLVVSAKVLLADLTGKNPNVFYELGLAHAARKPVLLLTQSLEDVPFDLQSLRVITYEVEDPNWGRILGDGIRQGLRETLESPERSVLPTFLVEEPTGHPQVSKGEARIIGLEQQVEGLRSELRARSAGPGVTDRIRAADAERQIEQYLRRGMPRAMIVRRLVDLGAPRTWVESELDRREAKAAAQ